MWSPAYVSFFGFGGRGFGVGFGFGFGSIGWLALGPRDIFHPWFGAGHSFGAMGFNDIHGAGFVRPGGPRFGSNLETMRTDARMRGAVRNVSSQDFASGRMGRSMPVSESMLRSASMMRGNLPVAHTQSSFGNRAGNFSNNRSATASGQHFFSRSGANSVGRTYSTTGRASYNWQGVGRGNQSERWPAAVNGGGQGRSNPAPQRSQYNWQRFASPSPYSSGRTGSGQTSQRGGWQGYSNQRSYSGGSGSRPPLNLNRPIMRQRAPSSGSYGGGRTYSAPSGGNHSYSAPSGGGRSYSAFGWRP